MKSVLGRSLCLGIACLLYWNAHPAQAADYQILEHLSGPVCFSPDGQFLLRFENTQLQLWDLSGQNLQRQREVTTPITDVDYTPDGRWLATGHDDGTYILWRSSDLSEVWRIRDPSPGVRTQPFALSADGRYLTVCKMQNRNQELSFALHVWDLPQQRLLKRIPLGTWPNELPGHTPSVELAYHPLGRYLTVAIEWMQPEHPRYLQVWDTHLASWTYWLPGSPPLVYSNNGHYFGYATYQQGWKLRLWHTRTNLLKTVPFDLAPPPQSDVALSPQGNYLVLASQARHHQRTVQILSTQPLKTLAQFQVPEAVDSFSFSRDEHVLLLSSRQDPIFRPWLYPVPVAQE